MAHTHPLDLWLDKNGHNRAWLAKKIEVSEATLSRLISGKQWPSRAMAERICKVTHRVVTPNDFLGIAEDERNGDKSRSRTEAAV